MYSIKKLAELAGVTPKALRIYEKKDLLLPFTRTDAGYRLYNESSLETLKIICKLKQCKFSLCEISELLKSTEESVNAKLISQSDKLLLDADRYKALASELSIKATNNIADHSEVALLVVNMQNDFVFGKLGFTAAKQMISTVSQFVEYAHSSKIPVIFLNDYHTKDDIQEFSIWGEHALVGTDGAMLCSDIKNEKQDYFIYKHYYSGFLNTSLEMILHCLQVKQLIVVGVSSNICVYHTVADAFTYGYKTTIITDLTAAQYKTDYHSSLTFMKGNFNTEFKDSLEVHLN